MTNFVELKTINLRNHPELNESWVERTIKANPSILGLGKLEPIGQQRRQPSGGRLDLMLQDEEDKVYEVELQLGETDPNHIIRTIEYWDVENKRYPQFKHCAVLIAEEITGRFFNVIGLFNGSIPIIAMKMTAVQVNESVGLIFTTVLGEAQRGGIDIAEGNDEVTDRSFWETRSSKASMALTDELTEWLKASNPNLQMNYVKSYIGLSIDGLVNNYIIFRPKKVFVKLGIRLPQSTELDEELEKANLEWDYKGVRYWFNVTKDQTTANAELIRKLFHLSYENTR